MSFLDRIAAAVTPAASDEDRAEARSYVESLAEREDWVRMIVDQHKSIEACFSDARTAGDPESRRAAVERLERELTGHAMAEEAVIYPVVAEQDGKIQAGMAYEEHSMTKVQLAKLKRLDPAGSEWREKLDHIESAVQQHVYQEESKWIPELVAGASPDEQRRMAALFAEQYGRYDKS